MEASQVTEKPQDVISGPSNETPTQPKMSIEDKKKLLASLPKKKKAQRMKERKIRDNYRLRKLVTPKHALMAINELKGVHMSDFTYTPVQNSGNQGVQGFTAQATIDGVAYTGKGRSKNLAKTDVCDQALRNIMLKKMTATAKAMEENQTVAPSDEVPIVTLVSYAIYKLFADWESEGYCLKCAGTKGQSSDPCSCAGKPTGLQAALAQIVAPPDEAMIAAAVKSEEGEEQTMEESDESD